MAYLIPSGNPTAIYDTEWSYLALHTSEFMDSARHIYESCGFEKVKELTPIFDKRYWLYKLELKSGSIPEHQ